MGSGIVVDGRLTSAAKADHPQVGKCRPEGLLRPKATAALPMFDCFMPVWDEGGLVAKI